VERIIRKKILYNSQYVSSTLLCTTNRNKKSGGGVKMVEK